MPNWQLYIRHAHRDVSDRDADNGLSERGFAQCEELVEALASLRPVGKPRAVRSSPSRRCMETAEAVAEWAGVEVEEDSLLKEQQRGETDAAFEERILTLVRKSGAKPDTAWVTHGDVLPVLARHFGVKGAEIKKGDFFRVLEGELDHLNGVRERRGKSGK